MPSSSHHAIRRNCRTWLHALALLRRPAPSIRRLRLATLSSSPCLTARCRRSAEITANRWRGRSCSTPIMPWPAATAPLPRRLNAMASELLRENICPARGWCAHQHALLHDLRTRSEPSVPRLASRLPATIRKQSRSRRNLCVMTGLPCGGRQPGGCEPLPARRTGIWPM